MLIRRHLLKHSKKRLDKNPDDKRPFPLQIMTGICVKRVQVKVMSEPARIVAPYNLDKAKADRSINIKKVQDALNIKNEDAGLRLAEWRKQAITALNAVWNIIVASFTVNYFVVVCKAKRPIKKLLFAWPEPRRVTEIPSKAHCVEEYLLRQKESGYVNRTKHLWYSRRISGTYKGAGSYQR